MNKELPQRKHPAHPAPVERHNGPVVLFVTACLQDRGLNLAGKVMHDALVESWRQADAWRVGWYLVMPDHVHLFCVPGVWPPVSVEKWAGYWKGLVGRGLTGNGPLAEKLGLAVARGECRGGTRPSRMGMEGRVPPRPETGVVGGVPGDVGRNGGGGTPLFMHGFGGPRSTAAARNASIWQRDCWDTQMRNYDHYVEKRLYVAMNPVRKGLVAKPEDWPWNGELHGIRW